MSDLTPEQVARYARHLSLPEIGAEGQEKLLEARVLVVGTGGLGSPAALYLAAAGIGTLGIMDDDRIEPSNLQRQIVHDTASVGELKVESAKARLEALNPDVYVNAYPERFAKENADSAVADYDFVIDATDNFEAKFLIADACHRVGRAYSHAGIKAFFGQTLTVLPGESACYRCVFESPPPAVAGLPAGPVGAVPGVIGSIQAMEAMKHILGIGDLLTDRLLTFDALAATFRTVPLRRNPACMLCGAN